MKNLIEAFLEEFSKAELKIENLEAKTIFKFNGYENYDSYFEYGCNLYDEFIAFLEKEIAEKKSKAEAAFLLLDLNDQLTSYIRTFRDIEYLDSPDIVAVFDGYFKNKPQSKKPLELIDNIIKSKERTSMKLEFDINIGKVNKNEIQNFLFNFINLQLVVLEQAVTEVTKYRSFINELSDDDFLKKKIFYNLGFLKFSLSRKQAIKTPQITIESLDIRQSALFHSYAEEAGIFLPYNNSDKAKLCSWLTGHSEHNLRTDKGFAFLEQIKKDAEKDNNFNHVKLYNLNSVKDQVEKMLELIQIDIEKYES